MLRCKYCDPPQIAAPVVDDVVDIPFSKRQHPLLLLQVAAHIRYLTMRNFSTPADHGEPVEMGAVTPQTTASTAGQNTAKHVAIAVNEQDAHTLEASHEDLSSTKSTPGDAAGMRRMGKEQQLVRHFRQLSVASFTALSTCAWELGLFLLSPGLINGGRAGLIWSALWCFVGFGPVYFSMAEMASMAPIAGAQYHWVSEFAPERYQRMLSYLTGYVPYERPI